MGLVAPVALGLAALALPIIALYLLKIRRQEEVVSSTLLWDRVARDLEANQPWQRFRPNWLLFLQLLALLALVAALARPFLTAEAALGEATVVVIDVSASMGAHDGDATRLDAAKREARDLIERMPSSGEMLIVAAGAQARVVQPMTGDQDALRAALDGIDQEYGAATMPDALALASSAAGRLPDAGIVVISDGDVSSGMVANLPVPVRVITAGSDAPANVGITTMAAGQGTDGSELFLRVWNASAGGASARVTVFDDDTDTLIAAQDITIPASSDTALTFPGIPPTTTVVRAELSGTERDDLAIDDVAWARTRSGERAKVLLVTPGNLFLERALALLPDLEVSLGAPVGGAPAGFDLYVFDGVLPPDGLQAPLLLFNPPSTSTYAEIAGDLGQPAITNVRSDDPILTDVDLSQTHLAAARAMTTPSWATPLVLSGESPLLFAGLRDGLRTAVVGFDLHASDLPLQTAFPILVANLTGWLLPETTALAPASISPGAVVALYPRTGADQIELERPDGTELRSGGFVVNLLDASESDLVGAPDAAQPGDDSGQGTVASGLLSGGDDVARRLLWWPAVAIGIAVLVLEWWAFYRGRWRPKLTTPANLSFRGLIPDWLTRRPRR